MRRDKNAPALYELVKGRMSNRPVPRRSPSIAPPARPAAPPRIDDDDDDGLVWSAAIQWLRPGRIVKIPVGYLFFTLAGIIIALFGSYVVGFKKMEARADAQRRVDAQRDFVAPTDPLVGLRLADPPASNPRVASQGNLGTVAASTTTIPSSSSTLPATQAQTPGVVEIVSPAADPRQADMNYLIAATLPVDEARRAGDFLAQKGLAIALVPVNNRSSRREVVILRGISRDQYRQGDLKLQIEERIKSLGREFARDHRGGDDFGSCWWKKYTG